MNGLWYAAAYTAALAALTGSLWVLLWVRDVPPWRIAVRRLGSVRGGRLRPAGPAVGLLGGCARRGRRDAVGGRLPLRVPRPDDPAGARGLVRGPGAGRPVYAVQLVGFTSDLFAEDQVVAATVCGCDLACTLVLVLVCALALLTLWLGHLRPTLGCAGCDATNVLYRCAPNTGAGSPTCRDWQLKRLQAGCPS